MSQKKNTTSKVPATKVEGPKTVKLTKSQRELFTMKRDLSNKMLGDIVEIFVEELKIDVVKENWRFDPDSLQFVKLNKEEK